MGGYTRGEEGRTEGEGLIEKGRAGVGGGAHLDYWGLINKPVTAINIVQMVISALTQPPPPRTSPAKGEWDMGTDRCLTHRGDLS